MSTDTSTPSGASEAYAQLHDAALKFINAQAQDPAHPKRMNFEWIESLVAPDFQHSWGHNYAVSKSPPIQGRHSFQSFTQHLETMLPNLESWETTVTGIAVDEIRKKVVLRITYLMRVKGTGTAEDRQVENDLVWSLEMNEEGKIRKSTEFIDAIAAGRIKAILEGQRGKVG
ncbi:hypothetical protein EK21DRAFT_54924 [Setomelanomma holmii]|uniref:SnoaL-like domain-containing protein n=1 Tax=Setomelanomma holmii TaxID=210430 RepID=A0A9P4LRE9_9PLEO|nr:hypothetical protein EK21DRAFT_54924 [Setomelanomma holmii]